MREVLDDLAERYDMVIVDTPALTVVSDALALVADDSTIVVVAAIGQSSRQSVDQLTGRSSSCAATRSGSSPT
jgi:Mrp family chromosome partitioning ATPase